MNHSTVAALGQFSHFQRPQHKACDLIAIFNHCFEQKFNTILVGGAQEPIYHPQNAIYPQCQVVFTADYYASALHEVAHWCVAGATRRQQEDYGYWYAPDGRTAVQQQEFERVEAKPQALEWVFSKACGAAFRVSADNLQNDLGPSMAFKKAIVAQAQMYCTQGVNERVVQFVKALSMFYKTGNVLQANLYSLQELSF